MTVSAQESHPFTIHDMLAMDRISDPQVSPDGTRIVFGLRKTDLEANRGRSDLWLIAPDGSGLRQLTSHEASDGNARWSVDGQTIFFLSSRSGSSQVWVLRRTTSTPGLATHCCSFMRSCWGSTVRTAAGEAEIASGGTGTVSWVVTAPSRVDIEHVSAGSGRAPWVTCVRWISLGWLGSTLARS